MSLVLDSFHLSVLTFSLINLLLPNRNVPAKTVLDGFILTRVHLKNESLYIIALGIIVKFAYTRETHLIVAITSLLSHD